MAVGLGIVESAWLFRRGGQAVRVVKVSHRGSGRSLIVLGPGTSRITHHFDDSIACALQQCEIERQLVARKFCLAAVVFGKTAVPGTVNREPGTLNLEPELRTANRERRTAPFTARPPSPR